MSDAGRTTRARGLTYQAPDVTRSDGVAVPGKATLAGRERSTGTAIPSSIGNAYIEGRGFCQQRPEARGCELAPTQFALLVDAYQKRVDAAARAYGDALGELRVDTLLAKDDDNAPLLGMLIDVMASLALGGIGSALAMIKADPAQSTFGLGLELTEAVDVLSVANVVDGSRDSIGWIVKAAVDHGKTALKASSPSSEKQVRIAYITSLQNASAIAWEHQREDPPGYATHADLIVLFHAFSAHHGFTVPLIHQALSDKIDRYLASSASRIGRHKMRTEEDLKLQGNTVRDTKVAWISDDRGVPVLYYMKQDAPNGQGRNAYDHTLDLIAPIDREFVVGTPVEPEFIEVAISRHRDIWGTEPEVRGKSPLLNPNDPRTWVPKASS